MLKRTDSSGALWVFFIILMSAGTSGFSQDEPEEISVIGTRSHDRASIDLAVPVDVLEGGALLEQGDSRTESMLSRLVPSLNVDGQPISDAATLVRPVNLRGLPPDSTLVLVNGKRRHRSSVISFLGGGINDGAQGPDIAAIPAIALKRIEVLRDGAAAQYGSDAVAGILNFVLKDDTDGGMLFARYGQYYYGDGENVTVSGNYGMPLGDAGFFNVSGEYNTSNPTSRSVQRTDAQTLIDAGNVHVRTPAAQIWGAPDIEDNYKLFANAGIDLTESLDVYSFASHAERTVEGGFYYRNPHTRSGIFDGGIDTMGTTTVADDLPQLLVIDHNRFDNASCPSVPIRDNVPDASRLQQIASDSSCTVFNEYFPGGFTPQFGGDVEDQSVALGVRGEWLEGQFTYDLSAVWGRHETDFFINNTINPQWTAEEAAAGATSLTTDYDAGAYREEDYTINLDFTTELDVEGFYSPVNVGFGLEQRNEQFEVIAGEESSWYIAYRRDAMGNLLDEAGQIVADPQQAALRYPQLGIGSNGFAGFQEKQAGKWDRDAFAAYVDVELDVTESFLFGVALRHEDHEGFDATLDGKVSSRVQITDTVALRGSWGTGFRVPTVGQENIRNVTTALADGRLTDQLTLSANDPILQGIAQPLEQEESTSYGLGTVFNVGAMDVTVDYYHIDVDDRIAQTTERSLNCLLLVREHGGTCQGTGLAGNTAGDGNSYVGDHSLYDADESIASSQRLVANELDELKEELRQQGFDDVSSIGEVRWFANDFDTTTEGIDVTATVPVDWFEGGSTTLSFAGNWNRTKVQGHNPDTIRPETIRRLEEALPKIRYTLTADRKIGPWRILGRIRYYDDFLNLHADQVAFTQHLDERSLLDLEISYRFNESFNLTVGAENLLDVDPDDNMFDRVLGAEFAENTPYDFNGGFYYAKAVYRF